MLVVAKGGSKGKAVKLRSAETLVGRGKGSDIRIPSSAVSRRHCRLSFPDGYLVAEDLGSANGIYVNGNRVKKHAVRPGDRLEIGPVEFIAKYQLSSQALDKLLQEQEDAELVEVDAVEDLPILDDEPADVEALDVEALEVEALEDEPLEVEVADEEPIEVEALDAIELDTDELTSGKAAKKDNKAHKKAEPAPAAKKKENKSKPAKEEEVELEGGVSGGDIRDILSQLE
jgi:pSer/pThr/pTyr-binding forkhead associated (FHA) protein